MTKKFILILAILSIANTANCFYIDKHIKGTFSLGTSTGISSTGNIFNLEFTEYFSSLQGRYGLEFETGKIGTTKYNHSRLFISYQYNFLDINSRIFFSVRGGGIATYEVQTNNLLNDSEKKFVPGAIGGIEIESFIMDRLAITLNVNQLYSIKSNAGNFTPNITFGVRHSF